MVAIEDLDKFYCMRERLLHAYRVERPTCAGITRRGLYEREEISLSLCFHSVSILQARCKLPLASTRKEITQTIFE